MQSGNPKDKALTSHTQVIEDTQAFSLGCMVFCQEDSALSIARLVWLFSVIFCSAIQPEVPVFIPKLWAVPCLPDIHGWTNCFSLLSAVVRDFFFLSS